MSFTSDPGAFRRTSGVRASGPDTPHQRPPFHIQVDEREADLQPIEVFGDAAVADFAEPEYAVENAEGMLHIGSHARLCAVLCDLLIAER